MKSLPGDKKCSFLFCLTLILFFPAVSAFCQTDEEPPEPPVLRLVTINQISGNTELTWLSSSSPDVAGYVIYLYKEGEGFAIDTIFNPGVTFYSVLRQSAQYFSESFVVAALDTAGNVSPLSNALTTIHVIAQVDSCNRRVILSWNKYLPKPLNVTAYDVLISVDNGSYASVAHLPADSSGYTINNFINGSQYCIAIEASLESSLSSTSNLSCLITQIENPPEWINADYATVTGAGEVSLEFTIDPSSEIDLFRLDRKTGSSGTFEQLALIRTDMGSVDFDDKTADLSVNNYYRLSAINNCNAPSVSSNLASNIVLKVIGTGNEIVLDWNSYRKWLGSVSGYSLYMDTGEGFSEVAHLGPVDTTYTVSVSEIMYKLKGDKVCFYVTASEQSNPYGISGESTSNSECYSVEEVITVPNLFTPDGDSKNDLFRPVITFNPSEYQLIISDRQGKILFESKDFTESWDGSDHGTPVSDGVYIWVLRVTTAGGRTISRTGTVTLFKNR
jgi:gliding motility-associated-like protein